MGDGSGGLCDGTGRQPVAECRDIVDDPDLSLDVRLLSEQTKRPPPAIGQGGRVPGSGRDATLSRRVVTGAVGLVLVGAVALKIGAAGPLADDVPADDVQRRVAAFAQMGAVPVRLVSLAEMSQAIASLALSSAQGERLTDDLGAGRRTLVWLELYDSDVEDGDVVEIRSAGFTRAITLTKTPVGVVVPVEPGGAVTLAGLIDGGGGGVTVGVNTRQGRLSLPPLSVGQTLVLPIVVR